MTIRQILAAINRIPECVNRIPSWDVGRAMTRPVTNRLLKAVCGYILGIVVFGLGGIILGIVAGIAPSEPAVRLMALALGLVLAVTPNARSRDGERVNTEGPAL